MHDPSRDSEPRAALTGLRGLAALVVVLSHSSSRGMPLLPWLDLDGTGKLGVWAFFALSAFLLTRQFLTDRTMFQPVGLRDYLVRRVFRIYPMFVLALLLDVWLGRIGADRIMPALLIQHAPDIFWTIPVEFQYYLLLPLVALLFARISVWGCVAVAAAAIVATGSSDAPHLASWPFVSIFVCGSAAAVLSVRCELSKPWLNCLGLASLVALVAATPAVMTAVGLDRFVSTDVPRNLAILWGPPMAVIILAAYFHPLWARILGHRAFVGLGAISFSLYLLHMLAVDAVRVLDIPTLAKGPLVLMAAVAAASITYRLVEEPFRAAGASLMRGRANRLPQPPKQHTLAPEIEADAR